MLQKIVTVGALFTALVVAPMSVHAQGKIGAIRTADIVLESPQFKAGAARDSERPSA